LEDWFKAQGHMGQDKKISLRQRIKESKPNLKQHFFDESIANRLQRNLLKNIYGYKDISLFRKRKS